MNESKDTDATHELSTADTMEERAGKSSLSIWLLMTANRFIITVILAVIVFVLFVVISVFGTSGVATSTSIQYLFSSMIGAIVTGTTLVLTISQLVISEENGPLGDQHKRMSDTMSIRTYMSEIFEAPAPANPSTFVRMLVNAVNNRAESLDQTVQNSANDDLRTQVDVLVDSICSNAQKVASDLEEEQFGTFEVVISSLNFNYSMNIFHVERILDEFKNEITEEQMAAFNDLKASLTLFGPAREHIKTIYFQWELVNLSRYILYVAIPALGVAGAVLMFVGPNSFPGTTVSIPNIVWILSVAFSFTSLPFLVFTAYILRIVSVAKRTLAIGPFTLRSSERES